MRQRRVDQALRMARLGLGATTNLAISAMVTAAATQYGIDPALALAVAQRESSLNPAAYNASSGAAGVMQLEPATAAQYGVTDPFDPTQNIPAGVAYLASLLAQYNGNEAEALAAYDWGPGNVNAAIAANGSNWLSVAPAETQNYVEAIAGVTPADLASPSGAPADVVLPTLTIDAGTGEPVEDDTNVDVLPTVNGGILGGIDTSTLLIAAGIGLGLWLLADSL